MAEYIISKEEAFAPEVLYKNSGEELWDFERIVRCRDCMEFIAFAETGGFEGYGICLKFKEKGTGTDFTSKRGYCAWGKPRVYHGPTIAGETEEDKQP